MTDLTFITGNKNKVREFSEILGFELKNASRDLIEIQSVDVKEVTKSKLLDAYIHFERPVLVEDTGVYIDDINGFPGALIKHYFKSLGDYKFCNHHKNCKITAQTVIGYYDGNDMEFFAGEVEGVVSDIPRGDNGFGWDNVFIPIGGEHKTFAEMTAEEKNKVSMRRRALDKLKNYLEEKKNN